MVVVVVVVVVVACDVLWLVVTVLLLLHGRRKEGHANTTTNQPKLPLEAVRGARGGRQPCVLGGLGGSAAAVGVIGWMVGWLLDCLLMFVWPPRHGVKQAASSQPHPFVVPLLGLTELWQRVYNALNLRNARTAESAADSVLQYSLCTVAPVFV